MLLYDSVVRLRQLNQFELSGYVVGLLQQYLKTGTVTGIALNTGYFLNIFYPYSGNPSGYVQSSQTGNFATQSFVSGNNSSLLTTIAANYYPLSNPSGFGGTGLFDGRYVRSSYVANQTDFLLLDKNSGTPVIDVKSNDHFVISSPYNVITFYDFRGSIHPYISGFDIYSDNIQLSGQRVLVYSDIAPLLGAQQYSFNSNDFTLVNGTGVYLSNAIKGSLINSGQLFDNVSKLSLDFWNRQLVDWSAGNQVMLDWHNRKMYSDWNVGGNLSIGNNRIILRSDGTADFLSGQFKVQSDGSIIGPNTNWSIDSNGVFTAPQVNLKDADGQTRFYANGGSAPTSSTSVIYDGNGIMRFYAANNYNGTAPTQLYTHQGRIFLEGDEQNGTTLYGSFSAPILNNFTIFNSDGSTAIDLDQRYIRSYGGGIALDYGGRLGYNDVLVTIDWGNKALHDGWSVDGGLFFDDSNCYILGPGLYNPTGGINLDWSGRRLYNNWTGDNLHVGTLYVNGIQITGGDGGGIFDTSNLVDLTTFQVITAAKRFDSGVSFMTGHTLINEHGVLTSDGVFAAGNTGLDTSFTADSNGSVSCYDLYVNDTLFVAGPIGATSLTLGGVDTNALYYPRNGNPSGYIGTAQTGNLVDRTTAQTISGQKTFNDTAHFNGITNDASTTLNGETSIASNFYANTDYVSVANSIYIGPKELIEVVDGITNPAMLLGTDGAALFAYDLFEIGADGSITFKDATFDNIQIYHDSSFNKLHFACGADGWDYYMDTNGFFIGGDRVVTANQTGAFATTGWVDNGYYPRNNPSGYITAAQAGGVSSLLVTGKNISGIIGITGIGGLVVSLSGNNVLISGGSATNTGNFITTGQTGVFVTTGQTGNFATTSFVASNYYPLASNPAGYVTNSQTGRFVTSGQTGNFVTTNQTGNFVTTSQTGAFATTGWVDTSYYPRSNPSGYITAAQLGGVNALVVSGGSISGNVGITGIGGLVVSLSGNNVVISGGAGTAGAYVDLTTNQDISGVKNFVSGITINTSGATIASDGTATFNKLNVIGTTRFSGQDFAITDNAGNERFAVLGGTVRFGIAGGVTQTYSYAGPARFNIGSLSLGSHALAVAGVAGQTGDLIRVDTVGASNASGAQFVIKGDGKVGVNNTIPSYAVDVNGTVRASNIIIGGTGSGLATARLQLASGVSTASGAPLKFTKGTLLGITESGALEYNGTYLYFTDDTRTRSALATQSWVTSQGYIGNSVASFNVTDIYISDAIFAQGSYLTIYDLYGAYSAEMSYYRQLYDSSSTLSVDWKNRQLANSLASTTLDWQNQYLVGSWKSDNFTGTVGNFGSLYVNGVSITGNGGGAGGGGGVSSVIVTGTSISGNVGFTGIGGLGVSLSGNNVIISGLPTGNFVTTSQTGNFVTTSQTGNFITNNQGVVYTTGSQNISGLKTFINPGTTFGIDGTAQTNVIQILDTTQTPASPYINLAHFSTRDTTTRGCFTLSNMNSNAGSAGDWTQESFQMFLHGTGYQHGYYMAGPSAADKPGRDAGSALLVTQGANIKRLGIGNYNSAPLMFFTNNTVRAYIDTNGNMGIGSWTGNGTATPTARLHITGGTTSAGTAPLKLMGGTLMSSPESGAMEFNGSWYVTDVNSNRQPIVTGNVTGFAQTGWVDANYYPRSNPSGYLTAGSISGVNSLTVTGIAHSGNINVVGAGNVTVTFTGSTLNISGTNTAANQTTVYNPWTGSWVINGTSGNVFRYFASGGETLNITITGLYDGQRINAYMWGINTGAISYNGYPGVTNWTGNLPLLWFNNTSMTNGGGYYPASAQTGILEFFITRIANAYIIKLDPSNSSYYSF